MLSAYRNGLIARGISNPDVGIGTEAYLKFNTLGIQLSLLQGTFKTALDAQLPDTATQTNLERLCAMVGIKRRGASGSVGTIAFVTSLSSSLVQTGAQLTSKSGLIFSVVAGGSFANGDSISVQSISTGSNTNLAEGEILTWLSPPIGAKANVAINAPGCSGGLDNETDEQLRARFFNFLSTPPGNGNASHLIQLAEASTDGVTYFCYPAYNGPATVALAGVRAPSATDKNRDIDTAVLNAVIEPYVSGNYPEHVDLSVRTVVNESADVAIALALSDGQWKNSASPRFPQPATSPGYCAVTAVTSSTVVAVNSQSAPSAGISQVAYVDRTTWTLYRARVLSFTGSGPYTITLDSPFPNIAVGDYVFPDCLNAQGYLDTLLGYFASLGPGELIDAEGLLPRALRRPLPNVAHPYSLGSLALKFLVDAGSEVEDADYLYRSATTPTIPSDASDPPNILVPRRIAFYEML